MLRPDFPLIEDENVQFLLIDSALSVGLFLGMLWLQQLGRRLGKRQIERNPDAARSGLGPAEGAVFALLGLLIAFTFSGALQRIDYRRTLIVSELNALGTAWLRIDLAPAQHQPALRAAFREYFDARLAVYEALPDDEAARVELTKVARAQDELWRLVVAASAGSGPWPGQSVVPAFNEVFDVASERTAALLVHQPRVVLGLLYALGLACALLAGFAMASSERPPRLHIMSFAVVVALVVYVIVDMEHPRRGLIRIDASDRVLHELRATMD